MLRRGGERERSLIQQRFAKLRRGGKKGRGRREKRKK